MASKDLINIIQAEFARFGLVPSLVRRAKHECFEWTTSAGEQRVLTLANGSESNQHLFLNTRADVRRLCKRDGLAPRPTTPASRAPKPIYVTDYAERIAQLEAQVSELTEQLLDLLTTPTTAAPPTSPDVRKNKPATDLLTYLHATEWTPLGEIIRRAQRPAANVTSALVSLAKRGLAENYPRVGWRKKANYNTGEAQDARTSV